MITIEIENGATVALLIVALLAIAEAIADRGGRDRGP